MSFTVKITAAHDGVAFSIDHQTFLLNVLHDENDAAETRLAHNQWYAQMLMTALTRLANTEDVKFRFKNLSESNKEISIREALLRGEGDRDNDPGDEQAWSERDQVEKTIKLLREKFGGKL